MKRIGMVMVLTTLCGAAQAKVELINEPVTLSADCLEVSTQGITIGAGECDGKKPKAEQPEHRSFKGKNNPGKGHKPKHKG